MIRLIIPCLFLACLVNASVSMAVDAANVVYRSLVASSEVTRFREIQRLSQDSGRLSQHLSSVVDALRKHGLDATFDKPPEASTVALFELIGKQGGDSCESALLQLVDQENPEIAMLAIHQLGRYQYRQSIDVLAGLAAHDQYQSNYAFRFTLIRALIEMGHINANHALVKLRHDTDGQLRYHIDTHLNRLTVADFGNDPDLYKAFKEKLSASAMSESTDKKATEGKPDSSKSGFFSADSEEPESLKRMRLKAPEYYGIKIHSKRLLFILDNSGSMKDPWYGQTRLERAKAELIKAIRELSGDVEFGIVAFHTRVYQWQAGLVEATESNKDRAIDFVRSLGYGDRTNTYGALRRALDYDEDLEAVYLLTDGKPTIGELVSHQAILSDILHRNRFRHLNLNTIGFAVDGFTREFLKKLAMESGGEFRDSR